MADGSDRSAVLTEVERFHGHFMYLNEELNLIAELLALEGDGRKRVPDLCREAKADLRKKRRTSRASGTVAVPTRPGSTAKRWSSPRPVPN